MIIRCPRTRPDTSHLSSCLLRTYISMYLAALGSMAPRLCTDVHAAPMRRRGLKPALQTELVAPHAVARAERELAVVLLHDAIAVVMAVGTDDEIFLRTRCVRQRQWARMRLGAQSVRVRRAGAHQAKYLEQNLFVCSRADHGLAEGAFGGRRRCTRKRFGHILRLVVGRWWCALRLLLPAGSGPLRCRLMSRPSRRGVTHEALELELVRGVDSWHDSVMCLAVLHDGEVGRRRVGCRGGEHRAVVSALGRPWPRLRRRDNQTTVDRSTLLEDARKRSNFRFLRRTSRPARPFGGGRLGRTRGAHSTICIYNIYSRDCASFAIRRGGGARAARQVRADRGRKHRVEGLGHLLAAHAAVCLELLGVRIASERPEQLVMRVHTLTTGWRRSGCSGIAETQQDDGTPVGCFGVAPG